MDKSVPCKSGDEVDAVLTVCGPVHEVVGAEVGVAPAIIWYILWRSISVWLCITIGSQRGSLIQDSMRSMMRLDDFSYSRTSVNPPSEESSGAEKSTVTFLPATGSSSNNAGKIW